MDINSRSKLRTYGRSNTNNRKSLLIKNDKRVLGYIRVVILFKKPDQKVTNQITLVPLAINPVVAQNNNNTDVITATAFDHCYTTPNSTQPENKPAKGTIEQESNVMKSMDVMWPGRVDRDHYMADASSDLPNYDRLMMWISRLDD